VVTHPRIFQPSSPLETAVTQLEIWLESPGLKLIGESGTYWGTLREIVTEGKVIGPKIHDAPIAAICRINGVRELWSADRDYSRIRGVKIVNPLLRAAN